MMLCFRTCHRVLKLPTIITFLRFNPSFSSYTKPNSTRVTNCIPVSIPGKSRLRPVVSDAYSYNIEITNLGRHGKVKEARKLFDEMPHRDAVSYASMLTIYLKNNDVPQAERIFRAMPERNVVADSAMINGFAKVGLIDKARDVFDRMVERNVFSWTSMVSGYFGIGKVDEAVRLFYQMPEKNVFSWTAVVSGYAQNGFIEQARNVFDKMPDKNIIAWTVMVKSYVDNDRIDDAIKLFHQMPRRNLYSWNIIISGCLNANRINEAIQLFKSMPQRNAISWTTMVTGLAQNGMIIHARKYFDQMPERDIAAWNAMITAYADEGNMVEANKLFNLMPGKNIASWNAVIYGYARNEPGDQVFKHLILMLRAGFKPNETTITSLLTSCENMMEIMQAHALVILFGFEHETTLANALVTVYSKCGDVYSARIVFYQLEAKDVVSWTAMLLAYSNHGCGHNALQVFARMLRSGAKPDEISFVGVLSACSHAGLVTKGQKLFYSMKRAYDLEPRAEHYSCLVDILGRAGQLNEAMSLVFTMPPNECDGGVLGALLGACRLHGDARLAIQIGEKLIELEPTSSGSYVLLANVYAAGGRWNEYAQVRRKMKESNVRKVPGFSQIEVKGKKHVFFAGDRSHPQIENIYGFLREKLLPSMQEMVYNEEKALNVVHI